jgi:hypothetical protein
MGNAFLANAAFRIGVILLVAGLATIAVQAVSEILLIWCVAYKTCTYQIVVPVHFYFFGILPMCFGAGMIALLVVVEAVQNLVPKFFKSTAKDPKA